MDAGSIGDRLSFLLDRLRERLWLKPLMICSLSVLAVFLAKIADSNAAIFASLPEVKAQSLDTLLSIMASSMLVIATFSVTSMVSAYASASSMATPRSFLSLLRMMPLRMRYRPLWGPLSSASWRWWRCRITIFKSQGCFCYLASPFWCSAL